MSQAWGFGEISKGRGLLCRPPGAGGEDAGPHFLGGGPRAPFSPASPPDFPGATGGGDSSPPRTPPAIAPFPPPGFGRSLLKLLPRGAPPPTFQTPGGDAPTAAPHEGGGGTLPHFGEGVDGENNKTPDAPGENSSQEPPLTVGKTTPRSPGGGKKARPGAPAEQDHPKSTSPRVSPGAPPGGPRVCRPFPGPGGVPGGEAPGG